MDWNYVALIAITVTFLLLMIQRAEKPRRRLVAGIVAFCLLIIRHNAFHKDDLHEETLMAFVAALLLNGLFWLLIGRYNPVNSSDAIHVIGMDD